MNFFETLTAAINDFAEHGFDSPERLAYWQDQLRRAADRAMIPQAQMVELMRRALEAVYRRLVERHGLLRYHPGVERFTLERIKPELRAELHRRILASADLIKLNRKRAIEQTLQRFSGWASSVPKGGSKAIDKREEKAKIRKSLAGLTFVERRVLIDQGHKLTSAISNTVATGSGAIALIWRSNWRQPNYNYREDHKERDQRVYTIRNNWAQERGLMKPGPAGYYDQITAVGEEVFCRCYAVYLYNLRQLPDEMLTVKGRRELEAARMAS